MLVRVSAISYLNTLPFIYGLKNHPVNSKVEFLIDTPARSADNLLGGLCDVGIVPTVTLLENKHLSIISDFCIASDSDVASVLLCSSLPVNEIKRIYLDSESRTSNLLCRILVKKHWRIEVEFSIYDHSHTDNDTECAYVLIGDKALKRASEFEYVYDLAHEWREFKSLPFVFACWTANKELGSEFLEEFNQALKFGVENIEKSVNTLEHGFDQSFAINYLKNNISYNLSPDKREGLSEFWSLALEELKSKVRWFG